MSDRYDFEALVRRIERRGLAIILRELKEADELAGDNMRGNGPRARAAHDAGAQKFRDAIGRLLSWLEYDTIASSSTKEDIAVYLRLAQRLKASGDFTVDDLNTLERKIADHWLS